MDPSPRDRWAAAFGLCHLPLVAGPASRWTFRERVWRGVRHVVARPSHVSLVASFHAVEGGPRGLIMRRVVLAGDLRGPVTRSGAPAYALPLDIGLMGAAFPEGWGNLLHGLGWGRVLVPAANLWDALRFPDRGQRTRSRLFGPMFNVVEGRRAFASYEPPEGANLPIVLWAPALNAGARRLLKRAQGHANALERVRRSMARRERVEGFRVH